MHDTLPFLMDMTLMLSLAGALALLCQKFRQPIVLGYIVTGILVGPHIFPAIFIHNVTQVKIFSELGVIFLMFATGLEFSFRQLKEMGPAAIVTGLVKVVLTITIGVIISRWWHWNFYQSLFFWSALSISSTAIIVKAIEDQGLKRKHFVELVFGLLIVEDLLAVIILTSLSTVMATQHLFSFDTVLATLKLIMIVGSWFLTGYLCVPWFFRKVFGYLNSEILTIVAIALCLLLATIATYLNYSSALGAFIMGSVLAETPMLAKRIKQLILPMRDIFAAVFFLSVGMMIDVQSLCTDFGVILFFAILLTIVKITVTLVGALLTGNRLNTAVRSCLSVVPVGEFSFIIMGLGVDLGAVDHRLFQAVIGVSTLTTLISPYLIQYSDNAARWLEYHLPADILNGIGTYSQRVTTLLSSTQQYHTGLRSTLKRLLLYGIAIMLIFIAVSSFVAPLLETYLPFHHVRVLSWGLAIIGSTPFIREIVFIPRKLLAKHDVGTMLLCWGLLLLELVILSAGMLGGVASSFTAVFSVAFVVLIARHQLSRLYNHLLSRLSIWLAKRQQIGRYDVLALLDTPLVTCTINNPESVLLNKPLRQLQLKQQYGVDITSIRRGTHMLLPPKGSDTLQLQDELMILGNAVDVTAFRSLIENKNEESGSDELRLNNILLKEDDVLIGKTVRSFNIAHRFKNGIIMGIERNGIRILNPGPNTLLKEGDLLLVLSQQDQNQASPTTPSCPKS